MIASGLKFGKRGPIGLDIGRRSVNLLQFDTARKRVIEASRWDFPDSDADQSDENRHEIVTAAIRNAMQSRQFRGNDAVVCLDSDDLLIQNVRVPASGDTTELDVIKEASGRLPYDLEEAEIRFLDGIEVRQGDQTMREVVLLACQRSVLDRKLESVVKAGLCPVSVDVAPMAMLRCFVQQFRRDEDHHQRAMYVHVGPTNSAVVIAHGENPLFIKYIEIGGQHFDQSVARHLEIELPKAIALRRQNRDRRANQQDDDIFQSITVATRPIVDRLATELSKCIRYHSVTFRGKPLMRVVLGGAEATNSLLGFLEKRLNLPCDLGEPLRNFDHSMPRDRIGQWDIAVGLALREKD